MKHGVVAAMVCLAMGSSACSFALPVPPSEPSQRTRTAAKKCSEVAHRWFYPVNDALGATIGGINMAIASNARPHEDVRYYGLEVDRSVGFWALGVAPLVVYGAGAIYGLIQCARCDDLLREHDLDSDGGALESSQRVERMDERETRWSNPGDGTVGAVVQEREQDEPPATLPEWSAFRREPLDEQKQKPKKTISPRTYVAPQP